MAYQLKRLGILPTAYLLVNHGPNSAGDLPYLARLMGLDEVSFANMFDMANLLDWQPTAWAAEQKREARRGAMELVWDCGAIYSRFLLLGQKTVDAFGFHTDGWYNKWTRPLAWVPELSAIPHPNQRNLLWNRGTPTREEGMRFLKLMAADAKRLNNAR